VRRALCRVLGERAEMLQRCTILEVNAGSGLVGLSAAAYAKSVTITTPNDLSSRLVRFNCALQGWLSGGGRARQSRSGAPSQLRRGFSMPGRNGPVPIHVYNLPLSKAGAEELAKQWQWDSGTAMRGLKRNMVAPKFDIMLVASLEPTETGSSGTTTAAEGILSLASSLLGKGGLLLAAAKTRQDTALSTLTFGASSAGLEVEEDEIVYDPSDGNIRVVGLRSCA